MKKDADIQDYIDHFAPDIGPEIDKYVTEVLLDFSRYIFTSRKGKRRFGYCTHCNLEFLIDKPIPKPKKDPTQPKLAYIWCQPPPKKEPVKMQCPNCGSECIVKASGRSRKYLIDRADFVYYEKSLKNPEAVVARCFHAWRDYTGNYRNIKTEYSIKVFYVFELGHSIMFKREWMYKENPEKPYGYEQICFWKKSSSIYSPIKGDWSGACGGIKEAVKDTPFQYSTWDSYDDDTDSNMVKFFDLYSRYPMIEYLTKLGFENLVKGKLEGLRTYQVINWRGKNLLQVLKLTKQEINEIRANEIDVSFTFLNLLKEFKKHNIDLSLQEIAEIHNGYRPALYYCEVFELLSECASARKGYNYFQKQVGKEHIASLDQAIGTWKDYIEDCKKLDMDLTQDSVVFPRNLYQAHQNTIEQVKIKADKELDKQIRDRIKKLSKQYSFKHEGLIIRPAKSTRELINEGKALHHCVGRYAQGYAQDDSIILFIRKASAPNKPYFTVEVRKNVIVQCRGLRNCSPDEKVQEFIEVYKSEKLQKKKSTKTKITVPA